MYIFFESISRQKYEHTVDTLSLKNGKYYISWQMPYSIHENLCVNVPFTQFMEALPQYNKVHIYDKNTGAEIRVILSQGKGTS